MCIGGKKSSPPPVPAPAAPTQFAYVNADTSNQQQKAAAVKSATGDPGPSSFGAELGSTASTAAPVAAPAGGM